MSGDRTFSPRLDLAEYETVGDLDAPLQLTAKHDRRPGSENGLRAAMRCDVPPVTYAEYDAGGHLPRLWPTGCHCRCQLRRRRSLGSRAGRQLTRAGPTLVW